jgi:pyruvate/2-oxoglutarate/acetoin dehydrogenase E1 component
MPFGSDALNLYPLIASVSKTARLATIEEGMTFSALGSEIIAQLLEQGVTLRSVRRLGNSTILPCSAKAEARLLPSARDIVESILGVTTQ